MYSLISISISVLAIYYLRNMDEDHIGYLPYQLIPSNHYVRSV